MAGVSRCARFTISAECRCHKPARRGHAGNELHAQGRNPYRTLGQYHERSPQNDREAGGQAACAVTH